ncbi:energy transducer TonB [Trinickia acidisoli]|uniref:energy transducer TonB n=1 Tax=Trinickia acidisoli TaxID=2767482 RepID=UPI002852E736|nr:energy transducer TonB [Trinickia acidisoli]
MNALRESARWEGPCTAYVAGYSQPRPRRVASVAVWGASLLAHVAALVVMASRFGAKADTPPVIPPIAIEAAMPAQSTPIAARAPEPAHSHNTPPKAVQPRVHNRAPVTPHPAVMKAEQAPVTAPAATPAPAPAAASTQPAPVASASPPAPPVTPAPAPEPVVSPPIGNAAYLHNPPPHYPQAAQEEGWEGRVVLRVHVDAGGHPVGVELHASSGHDMLDKAALTAVRQWMFVPAKRGTVPVDGWVDVPLDFRLN